MCGITGIKAFNELGRIHMIHLAAATSSLAHRGPDHQEIFNDYFVGLGHRRLSIIDRSPEANQPMTDPDGRFRIVFNGEIFNYQQLRQGLAQRGVTFSTQSDTEVLLKMYIMYGKECLPQLNGFFAFAVYDSAHDELFIARDRMGIKPLYFSLDDDKLLFASEMNALVAYGIKKQLDAAALFAYLQLNYIPAPLTIFQNIRKLEPGHFILTKGKDTRIEQWYQLPRPTPEGQLNGSYADLKKKLQELTYSSVKRRLIADVPVGTFLSGGIDSSVIAGIASRLHPGIHSFSIGYKDHPFFDETEYAEMVARHFGTQHHVFKLSNDDLLAALDRVVAAIDEPFADSSALPLFILSGETKKHVSVALSGDGADELFAGYNKHLAWQRSLQPGLAGKAVAGLLPLWRSLPASRSSGFGNRVRQLARYGEGLRLPAAERYWRWASFLSERAAEGYLGGVVLERLAGSSYESFKGGWLSSLRDGDTLGHFLRTDCGLVLPDDMLTKVDRMSMAHGLEVRVPFLDHRLVEFAFGLPGKYKLSDGLRKRIVQDAFREFLPPKLYNRRKKGFEVPLLHWMRNELRLDLDRQVFQRDFLEAQGVFNVEAVMALRRRLHSGNPGDAHATTWALYVFQNWWKRYME